MDDIVLQALAKWPNVPHCYGWLGLNARGNWYMRDDQAQAAGAFAAPQADPARQLASKGSLLKHEKLIDFIQRNYESDASGQWFFQNGPQRVYVELEATPWIWRIAADFSVSAHSGEPVQVKHCFTDEKGRLYLETSLGFGLVHTQDMNPAADAVEQAVWVPEALSANALPARFNYVPSPNLLQKKAVNGARL